MYTDVHVAGELHSWTAAVAHTKAQWRWWEAQWRWWNVHTDVHVAGELHSWTAAVALPTCGEGVDVLRTREREREISFT